MVKEEGRAEKKIPLLKRGGRCFRQTFPSFRTGTGPSQTAAYQNYIDEQLEQFVDSCKGSQGSGEGYFTPHEVREHANDDKWLHLGARPKTLHPQSTAPLVNFELPFDKGRKETQFSQPQNVLPNHARSLFKEYSDTEEVRKEVVTPSEHPPVQSRPFPHA